MSMPRNPLADYPVLGIVGWSGSGKTTLLEALLPLLGQAGLKVNVIKHSHHDLTLEPAGKDSARFRTAGAQEVMVCSPYRWAITHELRGQEEPTLAEQLARLAPADLILVEGFKHDAHPKLEVWRPENEKPMLASGDASILAVASNINLAAQPGLSQTWLDLDQPQIVADWILNWLQQRTSQIK
ncbi:molybdopterin-guanine dinucleotide biosynthesis protein B [Leeia oryzae]|uniref:molybdopterin-guanine dinucleotide biosynthesis protein B n=1 Tax=Leeia oryzae TaxID=356662 RepID=UPI0003770BDE|nr:molybdopterin-guanine dinucleotide biosynthesis protein B [Leeia oryzae]